MNILLVEDSQSLANLFRVQLRQLGDHTLAITRNKAQAIAAFKQSRFDIVFIDMGLDGKQDRGIEILMEIKALRPEQRAGMLSSNDLRDMVRLSQQAGAEFYMVKPFTLEGLALVLEGNKEILSHYTPKIDEGRIIVLG
jgi:two-component system chemotaxis response regulator CheY